MRTLTIYFHPKSSGSNRYPLLDHTGNKILGWMRAEVGFYKDDECAFEDAEPLEGEVVLKSVKAEL